MNDEVRPTPVSDPGLIARINETLNGIQDRSAGVILQVPQDGVLKGAVYANFGKGLSFVTWIDHDLEAKRGMGFGVAIRKKW